jgi:hypothetical protein
MNCASCWSAQTFGVRSWDGLGMWLGWGDKECMLVTSWEDNVKMSLKEIGCLVDANVMKRALVLVELDIGICYHSVTYFFVFPKIFPCQKDISDRIT